MPLREERTGARAPRLDGGGGWRVRCLPLSFAPSEEGRARARVCARDRRALKGGAPVLLRVPALSLLPARAAAPCSLRCSFARGRCVANGRPCARWRRPSSLGDCARAWGARRLRPKGGQKEAKVCFGCGVRLRVCACALQRCEGPCCLIRCLCDDPACERKRAGSCYVQRRETARVAAALATRSLLRAQPHTRTDARSRCFA